MRLTAAIVFVGTAAILAGCAPGANDELLAPIEDVALPGSSLGCEWGSSSLSTSRNRGSGAGKKCPASSSG